MTGWQQAMRESITDVDTLFDTLALPTAYKPAARRAAALFGLRVPAGYAARMRAEDALKRTPAPDADGDIFFDASDACHAQGDKAAGSADVVSTV